MSRRATPPDDELCRALLDEVPCTRPVLAAWLFGSAATGTLREDSDLDLAVLADADLDPVALFDAAQRLATRFGRDVDLVDLRRASAVMRAHVVARGRRLFRADGADGVRVQHFEMLALSDHARLCEERRPVVRALQERFGA